MNGKELVKNVSVEIFIFVLKAAVMPKSDLIDKKLEAAEMITAFKASQTCQDRLKGQILRVIIIDPDWMIRRNQLTGVILHRYIRAAIAVKTVTAPARFGKT